MENADAGIRYFVSTGKMASLRARFGKTADSVPDHQISVRGQGEGVRVGLAMRYFRLLFTVI